MKYDKRRMDHFSQRPGHVEDRPCPGCGRTGLSFDDVEVNHYRYLCHACRFTFELRVIDNKTGRTEVIL